MEKKKGILNGKVAVITGASQGLGEKIARLFASEAAIVILAARNLLAVEKIASELSSMSFSACGCKCDVQDPKQVESLARFAIQKYGRIDIWVNNAGISGPYGRTFDLPVEKFMAVLQTNVVGIYNGSKTALRHFVPRCSGKLINILGRGDDSPVSMQNAYASSKIWIKSFTLALAKEYKDSRVGIFAYNPGLMDTDFLRMVEVIEGSEDRLKVMPFLIKNLASSPTHAAQKALWLASSATDGKTGLYVRNRSRLGMLLGLVKKLSSRSKEPIELKIKTIPSAFEPLEYK